MERERKAASGIASTAAKAEDLGKAIERLSAPSSV